MMCALQELEIALQQVTQYSNFLGTKMDDMQTEITVQNQQIRQLRERNEQLERLAESFKSQLQQEARKSHVRAPGSPRVSPPR